MSHNLDENVDVCYLAEIPELFDGTGWHGRGIPTKELSKENVRGALFKFEFRPAYIKGTDGTDIPTGQRYAVALDNERPIATAIGGCFDTVDNEEIYDLFSEAIKGSRYKICSVLTLSGRTYFTIDAKADEQLKAAGRDIIPYVGITRGFGGAASLTACGHSTVIQCGNTQRLFIREASQAGSGAVKRKNTLKIRDQLPMVQNAIDKSWGVQAEFAKALEAASLVKVDVPTVQRGFVGFLGVDNLGKTSRTANRVNRLVQLFRGGQGNTGENAADFFSAITDYYTHESAGSVDSAESREAFTTKQWISSEYGAASRIKADLVSDLFRRGEFVNSKLEEWVNKGRRAIEASDKETVAMLS